jgi:hydroxyethylthiazole kinase-like uncharacterized protein yjeF
MKILTSRQIYRADQATIINRGISSAELMEEAAGNCFNRIINKFSDKENIFYIFSGVGNNGGDGLVIARMLLQAGYRTKTFVVNFSNRRSEDFVVNHDRLIRLSHEISEISSESDLPEIPKNVIVIDAVFGIGLTRPPEGFVKALIQNINNSGSRVISVDFPSGLYSEKPVEDKESVIKADLTLTFQNPKLAFLLPENENFIKEWIILDIGLDKDFIETLDVNKFLIRKEDIQKIYRSRRKFSHKGTFGHSLIIGGSYGKIGAVVLASRAASRAGSGLVTAYVPKCGYEIMQISNPEVMTEVDSEKEIKYYNFKTKPTAIGIGMGLGTSGDTAAGLYKFLKDNEVPVVIDADALNVLSQHKEWFGLLPKKTILTPHPKEFERMAGKWNNDYEKLDKLVNFSVENKCIVVLKGYYTAIAFNGKIYFNGSGNPALATGGSGDVLTGIITGLLAQKYTQLEAAILGVYLHGRAADFGVKNHHSEETFIASDIIDFIAPSYKELKN